MTTHRNRYSAERKQTVEYALDGSRRASVVWRGWVNWAGTTDLTYTPDSYPTKAEAVAAIKGQHPEAAR